MEPAVFEPVIDTHALIGAGAALFVGLCGAGIQAEMQYRRWRFGAAYIFMVSTRMMVSIRVITCQTPLGTSLFSRSTRGTVAA
jgi:hypothetical protein